MNTNTLIQTEADKIIGEVAKEFNVSVRDILGKNRKRKFTLPRQIAMMLVSDKLPIGVVNAGKIFNVHHSVISYGRTSAGYAIRDSKEVDESYKKLQRRLTATEIVPLVRLNKHTRNYQPPILNSTSGYDGM